MHTVCELPSFERAATDCGMSRAEVDDIIAYLAENPEVGDELSGTGGCRKLRIAGRGKGKSGGFRIVTFFSGSELPIFLITVFSKGERANLTKGERNKLAGLTTILVAEYQKKVVSLDRTSGARA